MVRNRETMETSQKREENGKWLERGETKGQLAVREREEKGRVTLPRTEEGRLPEEVFLAKVDNLQVFERWLG